MAHIVETIAKLVMHVGVVGHHVPCYFDFTFPRRSYHARSCASGVQGTLLFGRGVQGRRRPQRGSGWICGGARRFNDQCDYFFPVCSNLLPHMTTRVHLHTRTRVYAYTRTCVHAYTLARVHAYARTCVYVHIHTRSHACRLIHVRS